MRGRRPGGRHHLRTRLVRGAAGAGLGWRIAITPGEETLRIVHYNVWPEGKEELAVDSTCTRGQGMDGDPAAVRE